MEEIKLENSENLNEMLPAEQNRQIQLVINQPSEEEDVIDFGNVFQNMKRKAGFFVPLLMLFLVIGLSVPLLIYQFTKSPLTVSSVVTLRYEVDDKPVSDLTAPDGTPLDLNQVTSSYVLQEALDGFELSKPITLGALRNNIGIQTVLTEESQRAKEALAGLAAAKNSEAYVQLQNTELKYQNRFIVTLTNGFSGNSESRGGTELKSDELILLLDRILNAYNNYLVRQYADLRLPEDPFSMIDVQELDVLDSLDQIRSGIAHLRTFISDKSETIQNYRSWQTGRSLIDLDEILALFRGNNVDYLYAYVLDNSITRDKDALLTSWRFTLRQYQNEMDELNEAIAETEKLLANYKNDEVFITMQESDAAKSTKSSTAYYNSLILQQMENYDKAAEIKTNIADYSDRITRLENTNRTDVTEAVETELSGTMTTAQGVFENVRSHMEELFESPLYTTFEDHSAPQGKQPNFLAASAKKMLIGGALGAFLACGSWFLAGLIPEFSAGRKKETEIKEAA